jgi:hypothetical protein
LTAGRHHISLCGKVGRHPRKRMKQTAGIEGETVSLKEIIGLATLGRLVVGETKSPFSTITADVPGSYFKI